MCDDHYEFNSKGICVQVLKAVCPDTDEFNLCSHCTKNPEFEVTYCYKCISGYEITEKFGPC